MIWSYSFLIIRDARGWNSWWRATRSSVAHKNFAGAFTRLGIYDEINWEMAHGIPHAPVHATA